MRLSIKYGNNQDTPPSEWNVTFHSTNEPASETNFAQTRFTNVGGELLVSVKLLAAALDEVKHKRKENIEGRGAAVDNVKSDVNVCILICRCYD